LYNYSIITHWEKGLKKDKKKDKIYRKAGNLFNLLKLKIEINNQC